MTAAQRLALHGSEAVHVCRWLAPALLRKHAWHSTSCMGAVAQARRNCQQSRDARSHRWALRTPLTAVSAPPQATPASNIRWQQQRSVMAAAAAAPAAEQAADTSGECSECAVMYALVQRHVEKMDRKCTMMPLSDIAPACLRLTHLAHCTCSSSSRGHGLAERGTAAARAGPGARRDQPRAGAAGGDHQPENLLRL